MIDRDLLVARYVVNDIEAEELVSAAVELVLEGAESMHVAVLAGAERDMHPADVRELFEKAVDEMGWQRPNAHDAALRVARDLARRAPSDRAALLGIAHKIIGLCEDDSARQATTAIRDAYYHLDYLFDLERPESEVHEGEMALRKALADFARD